MKKSWILPASFLILLMTLIGTVGFLPAGADITGSAKFDPDKYYVGDIGFGVAVVSGTIRFPSGPGPTVTDINASTILLEGSLPPDNTYLISGGLVAEFDSEIVGYILLGKLDSMGYAPPYKIWLTITGKLNDAAGGTPFSATGYIKIVFTHSPPPP